MGSNLDKTAGPQPICPLCHHECRNRITLGCNHSFCQGCIGELWSGSSTGPYYCPECNYEHRKLPDLGGTDGASTSAGINWTLGKRLSERYSPKKVLGKRNFSSTALTHNSGGYRLGTALPKDTTVTVDDSFDDDTPPKKKMTVEIPSSGGHRMSPVEATSSMQATTLANRTPSKMNATSTTEPSLDNHTKDEQLKKTSSSRINMPQPEPAAPAWTDTKEFSPKDAYSSNSPDHQSRTVPHANDKPPEFGETSDASMESTSACNSVLCHYCSSSKQRSAVKSCLVCCASMCSEHLQIHLNSPVFQSHPLVPAVENMSAWRCQEHQEMNRIYCRPCGVCVCTVCTLIGSHKEHACISIKEAEQELRTTLKSELKKIQIKETAVLNRVTQLKEKQQSVQEVLEGKRAAVLQQYQAMRKAFEMEEQQAISCVTQEASRVLGSIAERLHLLKQALTTIQSTFTSLQSLGDTSQAQDQIFIMEYRKIAECLNELSDPIENMESVEEVNHSRLDSLQDWTERRLNTVIISMPHRDPFRLLYGLSPTLDLDTAHPKLLLTEDKRRVEYSEAQQAYPEHGARFSVFPQVLASKALCQGRYYWEVEVSLDEGRWKVGVCDGQIARKGQKDSCRIGFYPNSWCLVYDKGKVEVLHDKVTSPVCATGLQKVGVLLDFEEGCLTFYSVSVEGTLNLLYSFKHAFSKPLYPALAVSKTQLSICDLFARHTTD
ncbi:E3 ubiquitin/ISG15 ligase TRIM25 [Electrophorus electricus]|uniref:E3 ubiquitin/ISG15 ligase TRIM25 n=1 Tax=Electrophorus electricus TaxID=8005 RepID=UPI0015D07217|nr:E3 ubiquitin/ISG15 ligase TRIM25 [Electrophorus electricus]